MITRGVRVRIALLVVSVLCHGGGQAWAQVSTLAAVSDNVLVSADLPDAPHIEPRLAVDPKNAAHLVVGSMLFRREDGEGVCTASVSMDSGATWRRSRFLEPEPRTPGGDPWVTFDVDGTAYLSCMHAARRETGEPSSKVGVYRSEDGGLTWEGPVHIPGLAFDRPVMVTGTQGEPGKRTVHVIASQSQRTELGTMFPISVATSRDGGRTFSPPVQLLPNNVNNNMRSAVGLPDGALLILYYDIGAGSGRAFERFRIWATKGRPEANAPSDFSPALFVNENAGGDAVDVAVNPRDGRLFVVWDVVRGGDARGVFLARSEDGGRNWSAPIRLIEPGDGVKRQHVPTLSVGDDGTVGVFWIDYRNDARGQCYDAYFRASRDGGRTWLSPTKLSSQPSCPQAPGNVLRRTDGKPRDLARRWTEGGDYHGLVAVPGGRYFAVWADSRSGVFQLRFASVDVNAPETGPQGAR